MKLIIICAFVTLAAASRNHYIILKSEQPITAQYREEDSKGFYSYGYSGDTSAKAEYKTADGTSKGFYSYIDSDGELQTVKYEAGRKQGFTASATNLPTPPTNGNNEAPTPVTDTPEVEMAKQEHLEAYREAALKASLEPDNSEDDGAADAANGEAEDADSNGNDNANGSGNNGSAENNLSAEQVLEQVVQQNTRELLLSRQKSRGEEQLLQLLKEHRQQQKAEAQRQNQEQASSDSDEEAAESDAAAEHEALLNLLRQQKHDADSGEQEASEENIIATLRRHQSQPQIVSSYVLNSQARIEQPVISDLRTIYHLENANGNVELKLDANNLINYNAGHNGIGEQKTVVELLKHDQKSTLHLPASHSSHSYYTVDNPSAHYTVEIPTILTTLPSIESIRLGGHHEPQAISHTYQTQRLNSKSSTSSATSVSSHSSSTRH